MSSDFAATMPYAIRRADAARTPSPTPAEVLQDEAPMFPATPVYARKRKTSGLAGVSPAALIGGGTVLVAAAVAVFALTWNGGSDEAQVAATPVDQPPAMAPAAPEQPAVNDPSLMAQAAETAQTPPEAQTQPQAKTQPIERAATPTPEPAPAKTVRAARVRPAPAAPSATDTAEDASAMLPDGPMPYVPDGQPTQPMTSQPASPSTEPGVSASTPPPVIVAPAEPPAATATPPIDAAPDATASDPAAGPTP